MLGRNVGEAICADRRAPFDDAVVAVAGEADLFVLNLECCVSERGERWPAPRQAVLLPRPAGRRRSSWRNRAWTA